MDDNPYASPEDPGEVPPAEDAQDAAIAEDTEYADSTLRTHRIHSRLCILFVAAVFGALSVLSGVWFIVNLALPYPGTNRPVIAVDPLWILGRAIHCVGLGALAWRLAQYQSAIKQWDDAEAIGSDEFLKTHSTLWKTGALVLSIFIAYSVIYIAFAPEFL
jgi:hypothetical protein